MLKKGQAVVYYKYLNNCPDSNAYIEAEKSAKENKIGFWKDSQFINPEDWRRGARSEALISQRTVSQPTTSSRGYIAGTFKYLKSLGLSRFTPGDPNYTRRRNRDGDGIACE